MTAFLDTAALYPFFVRSEEGHAAVRATLGELWEGGEDVVTTSFVLLETTALLQSRHGLGPVRDLVEKIVPLLRVLWVDESMHRRGVDRLLRENRRGLSLVDCVTIDVLEDEGIRDVVTFDPDLAGAGRRLLPR